VGAFCGQLRWHDLVASKKIQLPLFVVRERYLIFWLRHQWFFLQNRHYLNNDFMSQALTGPLLNVSSRKTMAASSFGEAFFIG
jgi:hypothetical protein